MGVDPLAGLEPYLAELRVPEDGKLVGTRLHELETAAAKADVAVIGVIRDGRRRYGTGRNLKLAAGDILVLKAAPAGLDEFRVDQGLDTPTGKSGAKAVDDGVTLVEAVVPEGARIAGKTVEAVGIAWRQNTTLMGIARKGRRIDRSLRKTVIEPGDILLLLVPEDRAEDVVGWLGGMPLADRGLSVTKETKDMGGDRGLRRGRCPGRAGRARADGGAGAWLALAFVAMRVVTAVGVLRPDRVAGRGASGLHDPVGRGAGGVGGHRADRRRDRDADPWLADLGGPRRADGGDHDPVGRPREHRNGHRGGTGGDSSFPSVCRSTPTLS